MAADSANHAECSTDGQCGDELDLTNAHLSDAAFQDVPLQDSLTALDLTANRLTKVDARVLKLPRLKRISFRQNLLTDVEDLGDLASASGLEYLVLHDNQLQKLPPVANLTSLLQLEVSYNEIRSIASLSDLGTCGLRELYAANNKISEIQGVQQLTSLRILELGSNRIRELHGLEGLGLLEELWLGRNRIASTHGLCSLTSLRKLSLQSNRLESMRGIAECPSLKELYLSHNGIRQLEDLEGLRQLEVLDVSSNRLTDITGLSSLTNLHDLWLNDNEIGSLDSAPRDLAAQAGSLTCIYLSGNRGAAALAGEYRTFLLRILPRLEQIDADIVRT